MIKEQGISIDKNNYPVSAVENDSFTQYIEAQLLENYKSYDHFTEACIFMVALVTWFHSSYQMNSTYCINFGIWLIA